ncbi:MAG: YceI family protein [Phycisphaerales bacterium]
MQIRKILAGGGLVALGAIGATGVAVLSNGQPPAAASAAITPASFTAAAAAGEIDGVHSGVVFRIMHGGSSPFHGIFPGIEGTLDLDPSNPEAASIDVTIDVTRVLTGNNSRDEHLRAPDYFNVRQFPTSTFKANGGTANGDGSVTVDGELTLLGKTLPVSATITKTGEADFRGQPYSGFEATMSFDRSDFGMMTAIENGGLGDTVELTVFVKAAQ